MNKTFDLANCHTITSRDQELVDYCIFWVGGVVACCIGIPGVILNLAAVCLLPTRFSKKNNFKFRVETNNIVKNIKATLLNIDLSLPFVVVNVNVKYFHLRHCILISFFLGICPINNYITAPNLYSASF